SHFRVFSDSIKIYSVFVKYFLSSVLSFLLDILAYSLLIRWLVGVNLGTISIASFVARSISSSFNYYINNKHIFSSQSTSSLMKYFSLVFIQIIASSWLYYFLLLSLFRNILFSRSKTMNKKYLILCILTLITLILYIVWRAVATLSYKESWFAILFGILLLICEAITSLTAGIFIWSKFKAKEIAKPIISDQDFLDIDVFIATHNEDVELLYKTVNACVNMKYPDKSKVHIYLADDTNRKEVFHLAQQFNIHYLGMEENKE